MPDKTDPSVEDLLVQVMDKSWNEETVKGLKNSNNCSGFVRSVANKAGIDLQGVGSPNADGVLDQLDTLGWEQIKANPNATDKDVELEKTSTAAGNLAAQRAAAGHLVIVGLKADQHKAKMDPQTNKPLPVKHGHVAIVVNHGNWYRGTPPVWGGSSGMAQSRGTKGVGEVWNRTDRNNVVYYVSPNVLDPSKLKSSTNPAQ